MLAGAIINRQVQRASLRVAAKAQTFFILLFIRFGDSQSQLRGLERP